MYIFSQLGIKKIQSICEATKGLTICHSNEIIQPASLVVFVM